MELPSDFAEEALVVKNLSYAYHVGENKFSVIDRLSISVKPGELVCLFGPNACGKSTLLKLCAGILDQDAGKITVKGSENATAEIGYLPQMYGDSLMPWLSAVDNVAFPLYASGRLTREDARSFARESIEGLPWKVPENKLPHELSGGQKQMVCLARALVGSPSVVLADEPFSALDFETHRKMQDTFHSILSPESGIGTVMVTHEINDAVYMSDRILVANGFPMQKMIEFRNLEPRPRSRDFAKSDAFFEIVKKIMAFFE